MADIDKIDYIIEHLKEMLKARGDDISEFEEHEVEVEREEFFNDSRVIDFHTDKSAIIFALTKNLRSSIIDALKKNKSNLDGFVKDFNGKLVMLGHSMGALFVYHFIQKYASKCLFAIVIDGMFITSYSSVGFTNPQKYEMLIKKYTNQAL